MRMRGLSVTLASAQASVLAADGSIRDQAPQPAPLPHGRPSWSSPLACAILRHSFRNQPPTGWGNGAVLLSPGLNEKPRHK
jgi:hypothetical protein